MNGLRIAITLATLLVVLTLGVAVAAAPPLPASFYGTVTIAGQNVRGRPPINRRAGEWCPINRAAWSRIYAAWCIARELIRGCPER